MKNDIMDQLSAARPDALDPQPDPGRRGHQLTSAFGQPLDLPVHMGLRRSVKRAGIGFGVATGLAGAAAVAVLVSGTVSPVAVKTPSTAAVLSAHDVLLAAADRTLKPAATTGLYWRTQTTSLDNQLTGSPGNPYIVQSRGRTDSWTARSAKTDSFAISQSLGAQPATPADIAAWRKDGSPKNFTIVVPKSDTQGKLDLPSAPGKPWRDKLNGPDGSVFALGGTNVTVAQLQALPTDPAALKKYLLGIFETPGNAGGDLPTKQNEWLFRIATGIIWSMPVTPQTRAAAYRMLAALPGVQSLGTVQDSAGRSGPAVAVVASWPTGTVQDRLVINQQTGLPLAEEYRQLSGGHLPAGSLVNANIVDFAGWTNGTPPNAS
jgi:hypothetical protein